MDFIFIMFVLSSGFFIGSYFLYWHVESIIISRTDIIIHEIETLFSSWRSVLREDIDSLKECINTSHIEYTKIKDSLDTVKSDMKTTFYKSPKKNSKKTSSSQEHDE